MGKKKVGEGHQANGRNIKLEKFQLFSICGGNDLQLGIKV